MLFSVPDFKTKSQLHGKLKKEKEWVKPSNKMTSPWLTVIKELINKSNMPVEQKVKQIWSPPRML